MIKFLVLSICFFIVCIAFVKRGNNTDDEYKKDLYDCATTMAATAGGIMMACAAWCIA